MTTEQETHQEQTPPRPPKRRNSSGKCPNRTKFIDELLAKLRERSAAEGEKP